MATGKKRLDLAMLEKGLVHSRQRAQALIMAGKVQVNNQIVEKPGTPVFPGDDIVLKGKDHSYVSRGGLKLEKALQTLGVDIKGFVCLFLRRISSVSICLVRAYVGEKSR